MYCKNNPKRFWNLINNLGPKRKNKLSRNLAVSIEGNFYFDRFNIESKWFEDFQRLYNGPTNGQLVINKNACFLNQIITRVANRERQMLDQSYEENIMLNSGISFDEIENEVQKLKKKKSVGIDQIPNEILCYFDIMVFMYDLFNYCYTNGVVPTAWAKAIISPVLKPGKDPHFPLSYRGISLLSCMGKVFSSVISNKIVYYCDSLNLLASEQNGFRKNRLCSDHLFTITSIIRNRTARGEDTFVSCIDMEKAFDWVDRTLLLYKLLEMNIDGKIYNCIKALYLKNSSFVSIGNGYATDWFDVTCGVRQGDPLSTTLFNIFINDLVEHVHQTNVGIKIDKTLFNILLYADDILLVAKSEAELQILIHALETWCNTWKLRVNVAKTNVLHFRGPKKKRTTFNFEINNEQIEIVNTYKYL